MAAVAVLTACGVDQGVETLGAAPSPPPTTPPASTVPSTPTTPPETSTPEPTTPEPSTPAAPETTAPATTAPTLPPILEPELAIEVALGDVVDIDENKPPQAHDPFVAVALTDIERWWTLVYPDVYGGAFVPLEGGVYAGYPERQTDLPGCGEPMTSYQDLALFGAFYCQFGDFMVYDDGDTRDSLLTTLANDIGPAVMGVVLAHEYGHAIQERSGALERTLATIYTEQQADCFAGAWTGQAYRGESDLLRLGDADVRAGLVAMLSVRDEVGLSQFVEGGHGSAFDRVGAFQEGFVNGPARCAELLDDPLTLMPNQFQTLGDQERGGNASYDCSDSTNPDCRPAYEFLAEDLDHFWATELDDDFPTLTVTPLSDVDTTSCTDATPIAPEIVLCADSGAVFYDEPEVRALYDEFGDFTLGYFYGITWAELAQQRLDSDLTGEQRALANDCFTGAWVRDITPDEVGNTPRSGDRDGDGVSDAVTSSPGDLDEAIQMAILVGDRGANVDIVGSPFEKIDAFRAGVLGGFDACLARLD